MSIRLYLAATALIAGLAPPAVALAQGPARGAAPAAPLLQDSPFPPYKILDNLYFVGTSSLGSFLITTPQGHILINTQYASSVPELQKSIKTLGFELRDIKFILNSHAHPDHVGGTAQMKQLTGARVLIMDADVDVVRSGGKLNLDPQFLTVPNAVYPPVPVDEVLHHGSEVKLGGVVLTALKTPGHTPGCTTWAYKATQGGRTYNVVIAGSLNANPGFRMVDNKTYPTIVDDFVSAIRYSRTIPVDIFLGAHTFFYGMQEKYERLQRDPSSNPFVDPEGYLRWVDASEKTLFDALAKQMRP